MKIFNPIFVLVFLLIISLQSCEDFRDGKLTSDNQQDKKIVEFELPKTVYLNPDSLFVSIPGTGEFKAKKITKSKMPEKVDYLGVTEIKPGYSELPLSMEEKLAGKVALTSKRPLVTKVDFIKRNKKETKRKDSSKIIEVHKSVFIQKDSINDYQSYFKEQGLITVQNEDTIFPPIQIFLNNPIIKKSLPFKYKDEAIYDISFLDADQKLPNSYIRKITKDKDGVIWLGTHTGGLISYDGQYFKQYDETSGLTDNQIISMLIDKKDRIWLGTLSGGLNCFDGIKNTIYRMEQGLPSNYILALEEDSNGNIWIGTDRGCALFDGEKFEIFTTKQGLPANPVVTIVKDNDGNMWFGTYGRGIAKWDGQKFTNFNTDDGLAFDIILAIFQDHSGILWFGSSGGGASSFDGEKFTNYTVDQGIGSNEITCISEDSDNNILFGTYGNGLTLFDGEVFKQITSALGLSDNYVRSLFTDETCNIWIGTDGGGVCKLNLNSFNHITKKQGLTNDLVLSVFQDNEERMIFSSFEGGVLFSNNYKRNANFKSFVSLTTEQGLSHNIVTSTIQDRNNDYWFGTYGGGVSKLDKNKFDHGIAEFSNITSEQGLPGDIIRSVIEDKFGNLWFATEKGAVKYDGIKLTNIDETNGLGSSQVISLLEDNDGAIWIGTVDGGVSRFRNDSLTRFTTQNGLANNSVWEIIQDRNNIIWFGTDGNGLSYFNGNSFTTINTQDGLCNDYVFSISEDNANTLWVGTTRGLSRVFLPEIEIDANNNKFYGKPLIVNYGRSDGLKSIDFYTHSSYIDKYNRIWWGTVNALTVLDLNKVKKDIVPPELHLVGLSVNEENVDFNQLMSKPKNQRKDNMVFGEVLPFVNYPKDLILPNNLNHLTFSFAATDWNSINRITYQYKLIGLDEGWNMPTTDNIADYRNIPAGKYTFVTRAKSSSGKWSNQLEYSFSIRPSWWLSWGAKILYLISLFIFIWLIIQWRVRIIKRQKTVLEKLVSERTKELDEALVLSEQARIAKSQFLATISHEIRTPLTAIMGLSDLALSKPSNANQKDYLTKIDRSASTMLSLINDILDFSKIEAGKLQFEKVPFELEIVLSSIIIMNSQQLNEKNIEFVICVDPDVPKMIIGDQLRIGQVITNLCSNAIKFTSYGEILLHISLGDKNSDDQVQLNFAVKDTGIGISEDQLPLLFDEFKQADNTITRKYGGTGLGLAISKSLINQMGGEIWVESKPDKGSTFFFNINVGVVEQDLSLVDVIPDEIRGMNILVCDDNKSVLNSMKHTLQSLSLHVETVETSQEALSILHKSDVDLLIIDQYLNGSSGVDLIVELISNPDIIPIKTILLTDSKKSIKSFEESIIGISAFLIKPVLPSILVTEILKVFGFNNLISQSRKPNNQLLTNINQSILGSRILLVEDNEINREVIFELVAGVNVDVDIAEDGIVAIKKVRMNKYDLILMDLHMPVMDGFYATQQIRKHNTQIPIIAITADAMDSVKEKCKSVGINDIVTKPIDTDFLYKILLKYLSPEDVSITSQKDSRSNLNEMKFEIPCLELKSALRRFGNNEELYFKMLEKFMINNKNVCKNIDDLLSVSDFKNAHLLIHTLKGESANIGANKIYEKSKEVEKYIINTNIKLVDIELKALQICIDEMISDLEMYFENNKVFKSVYSNDFKTLIVELKENLKKQDPKVFDLLDALKENTKYKIEIKEISEAVNENNYEKAFELIDKLNNAVEI